MEIKVEMGGWEGWGEVGVNSGLDNLMKGFLLKEFGFY